MTDARDMHPADDVLQQYADDPAMVDVDVAAHIEQCAQCTPEVARVRRVTAALALTSQAPPARPLQMRAAPARRWRTAVVPLALLAAAALAFAAIRRRGETRREPEGGQPIARVDTVGGGRDTTAPPSRTPVPQVVPRPRTDFGFGQPGIRPGSIIAQRTLLTWSASAVDSLATIARRDTASLIEMHYDSTAAGARALADSAAGRLRVAGIPASRIRRMSASSGDAAASLRIVLLGVRTR